MKAKSFWFAYGRVAQLLLAVEVLVRGRAPAAIEHEIGERPGDPPLQHAVGAELREDHVDGGEARVADRGRDRGGGVLRLGRREQRDPEDPEHERLAAFEDEHPPLADAARSAKAAMQSPPASLVTLIPAGPEANAPSSGALATTSRIAQSTCVQEDERRRADAPASRSIVGGATEPRPTAPRRAAAAARPSACSSAARRTGAATRAVSTRVDASQRLAGGAALSSGSRRARRCSSPSVSFGGRT